MPKQVGSTELVSMRSEDATHWHNPDGSRTAEFAYDQNYQDAFGDYQPVNLNFVQVSTTEWVAERSRYGVRAYREAGVNWLEITHRASGKGIRYQIPLSATVQTNYVEFTGFGLTWRYYLTKRGIKLESSPVASSLGPKSYSFQVQLVGGATLAQVANAVGGLDGENFLMPRAQAHCADGVVRTLDPWSRSGGTVTFTMDDSAFPPEAYPYTVDPSTTVSIGAGTDDIHSSVEGPGWPPSATQFYDTTNSYLFIGKVFSGGSYFTNNTFLRFDTSPLPDNAAILSAVLRAYVTITNDDDNQSLCGDFFDWSGSNVAADHSFADLSGAITPVDITALTNNALNDFTLLDPDTNISKTGDTKLRFGVTGGEPANWNRVLFATLEHATNPAAQLIVDYTVPTEAMRTRRLPTGTLGMLGSCC